MRSWHLPAAVVLASVAALTTVGAGRAAHADPIVGRPGTFLAVAHTRVLDTRDGTGAAAAAVPAHGTVTVDVLAVRPAADITAAALSVTVTSTAGSGYLTAWAAGRTRPETSDLNFTAGDTVTQTVLAPTAQGGEVSFYNGSGGSIQIIADLSGYYLTPQGAGDAGALTRIPDAQRLADSRTGVGLPKHRLTARSTSRITVHSGDGPALPAGSVVVVHLTAVAPAAGGYLTAYPDGRGRPSTSNVNYASGRTVSDLALATLGTGGRLDVYSSGGPLDLVVDLIGYVGTGNETVAGTSVPVAPARLLDTRTGVGAARRPLGAGQTLTVPVAGHAGIPSDAAEGVEGTVTVTGATAGGHLTVWNSGTDRPTATTNSFAPARTTATFVVTALGTGRAINVYNGSSRPVDVVFDVSGYLLDPPPPPVTWGAPREVDHRQGRLAALSCATATACTAADEYGNVLQTDGTTSATPVPLFTTQDSSSTQLSCPTPGFCLATASRYTDAGDEVYWSAYDGTAWSAPALVAQADGMDAVSCVSASYCVFPDHDGQIFTFTGAGWTRTADVEEPGWTAGEGELVSCASTTSCTVVLQSQHVVRYDGTGWTHTALPGADANYEFTAVSCPTATFCALGESDGLAFTYDDGVFRSFHPDPTMRITDLSCASATACAAVDDHGSATTFDGTTWTAPTPLSAVQRVLTAVSCTTGTHCVAIDDAQDAWTHDDNGWSAPSTIEHAQGTLTAVDCLAGGFCAAVDAEGNAVTFDRTSVGAVQHVAGADELTAVACPVERCLAVGGTPDGASGVAVLFTATAAGDVVVADPDAPLSAVACAGAVCRAVDTAGRVVSTTDGTTFSAARAIDTVGLTSITCAPDGVCLAGDEQGRILTWDGSTWSAPRPVTLASTRVRSVACVSDTLCAAGDDAGRVYRFDGSTWSAGFDLGDSTPAFASCVEPTDCRAVSAAGAYRAYDGSTWTPYEGLANPIGVGDHAWIRGLSCPVPASCAAVSGDGYAYTATS